VLIAGCVEKSTVVGAIANSEVDLVQSVTLDFTQEGA